MRWGGISACLPDRAGPRRYIVHPAIPLAPCGLGSAWGRRKITWAEPAQKLNWGRWLEVIFVSSAPIFTFLGLREGEGQVEML
jgi:hypothetical protein